MATNNKQQAPQQAPRQNNVQLIEKILLENEERIKNSLPRHMDAAYMIRAVMKCVKNPDPKNKLPGCSPQSVLDATLQAAHVGLTPEASFAQGYLIPYAGVAVFQIGYLGLVELARREGHVSKITAQVVYENDIFDIEFGLNEKLVHKPRTDDKGDRGEPVAVWCCAWNKEGVAQYEYLTAEQVDYIRNQYSKQPNGDAWSKAWGPMAMKTVAIRLLKWLPKSVELTEQLQYEAQFDNLLEKVTDEYERRRESGTLSIDSLRPSSSENRGHDESIPQKKEPENAGKAAERMAKVDKRFATHLLVEDFSAEEQQEIQEWMTATNKKMSPEEFLKAYSGGRDDLLALVRKDTKPTELLTFRSFDKEELNDLKPWFDLKGISTSGELTEWLSKNWTGAKEVFLQYAKKEIIAAEPPMDEPEQETVSTGTAQSKNLFGD